MFKTTLIPGELKNHRELIGRIRTAMTERNYTLTVVFPTISLLHAIEDELLAEPEISGIGGVRFFLFEGFLHDLCERLGINNARPGPLQEELFLTTVFGQLATANQLDFLNRAPFNATYRRAILEGFREWQRAGFTPEHFRKWAAEYGPQPRQLALLYQGYQDILNVHGFQTEEQICRELQELRAKTPPPAVSEPLILYGYTDLTPLQKDFLGALQGWFDLECLVDPTRVAEFQESSARYFSHARLKFPAEETDCGLLGLQQRLWSGMTWEAENLPAQDGSIRVIRAAGAAGEARAVLREIAGLLRENPGYGLEDFLILAPAPAEFAIVAAPLAAEYGLPVKKYPVTLREYPVVSHFFDTAKAVYGGWQWPDLSLLIPFFYREADPAVSDGILQVIGVEYGALSGREHWLQLSGDCRFSRACQERGFDLAPLCAGLERLAAIPEVADFCSYLDWAEAWFAMEELTPTNQGANANLRRSLEQNAVKTIREALRELRSLWNTAEGVTPMNLEAFHAFGLDFLAGLDVAPPRQAGPLLRILSPREARGLQARFLFITGLNEGEFPRPYIGDWKLSLAERLELNSLGFMLETGAQHRLQERMAFYWSIQSARERLYLVGRNQNADGTPVNASVFLEELQERLELPANCLQILPLMPREPQAVAGAFSDPELRARIAFLLNKTAPDETSRNEIQPFFSSAHFRGLVRRLYRWELSRLSMDQTQLSPEFHRDMVLRFNKEYSFAVTALERYRECPYQFYLQYLLGVQEYIRPEMLPDPMEMGGVYHQLLQEFCAAFGGEYLEPRRRAEYLRILRDGFSRHFSQYLARTATPLSRIMLELEKERAYLRLEGWLDAELEWSAATENRFRFTYQELSFGDPKRSTVSESFAAPYQLEKGAETIRLRGRIDRVDVAADGSFTIYDYKTGQAPAKKRIESFDLLQLPAYMLALESLLPEGARAVGGAYLSLKETSRQAGGVWNSDRLGFSFTGSKDEAAWQEWLAMARNALLDTGQAIRAGRFFEKPQECKDGCPYQHVCRNLVLEEVTADENIEAE